MAAIYLGLNQEAVEALLNIHDTEGTLKPEKVVEEASDPTNPLHEHFTWDDTVAAHQYRLYEARKLIASVEIQIDKQPETRTRAFVSIGKGHEREYQTIEVVLDSTEMLNQYRAQFEGELRRIQRDMSRLEAFQQVADQLEPALAALAR